MSIKDALIFYVDEIKTSKQPLTFQAQDDAFQFVINIIENLFDFQKWFQNLVEQYKKDNDIKNNFLVEFSQKNYNHENSILQIFLTIIIAEKNIINLLNVMQLITNIQIQKDILNQFDQFQQIDYSVQSPFLEKFNLNWKEIEVVQDIIIDTNDPIYLWRQKNTKKSFALMEEQKNLTQIQFDLNDLYENFDDKMSVVHQKTPIRLDYSIQSTPSKDDKISNSKRLFITSFESLINNFQFKEKPKTYTIQEQDYKCKTCGKSITKGLYFAFNNARYINKIDIVTIQAFGTVLIVFHMKNTLFIILLQRILIQNLIMCVKNMKKKYLMDKPILQINYDDPIVTNNKVLFEFLLIRRQIHLIYDRICDLSLIHELFKDYINFILKINIFSMQNLYELNIGILGPKISKFLDYLIQHIQQCDNCQKRGKICQICKNKERIFNYDIKNTQVCEKCRYMYHRVCLEENNCPRCLLN